MKTLRRTFNLLGGLVLLPVAIARLVAWPVVTVLVVGTVIHFVVKCW